MIEVTGGFHDPVNTARVIHNGSRPEEITGGVLEAEIRDRILRWTWGSKGKGCFQKTRRSENMTSARPTAHDRFDVPAEGKATGVGAAGAYGAAKKEERVLRPWPRERLMEGFLGKRNQRLLPYKKHKTIRHQGLEIEVSQIECKGWGRIEEGGGVESVNPGKVKTPPGAREKIRKPYCSGMALISFDNRRKGVCGKDLAKKKKTSSH